MHRATGLGALWCLMACSPSKSRNSSAGNPGLPADEIELCPALRGRAGAYVHRCTFGLGWLSAVFASQSIAKIPLSALSGRRTFGRCNVAHYRACQVGTDGRIKSGADLDCLDDEAAIETAKQLVGEYDVELWHDSRLVARLRLTRDRCPNPFWGRAHRSLRELPSKPSGQLRVPSLHQQTLRRRSQASR